MQNKAHVKSPAETIHASQRQKRLHRRLARALNRPTRGETKREFYQSVIGASYGK